MNMDTSGEVADLMVKESIQVTEAGIKLLAAGSKNLAAFLWALAKDGKKVAGLTSMAQLYRSGRPTALFRIKESDLKEFRAFAKKECAVRGPQIQGGQGRHRGPHHQCGLRCPGQPVYGAQGLSGPGTGGGTAKKRRPPRSARVLLTTAREWLDSLPDEADEADDEDY